jgi:hypothetical protein
VAGRAVSALESGEDGLHRLCADLGRELLDRREGDRPERCDGSVVVADDRHVLGNLHAEFGERVEHPQGAHVVAGEDGRHGVGIREEFAGRVVAAALGERCVHDADLAGEPVPVHGGLVALDPLGAGVLADIGKYRDSGMSERDQVIDDELRTLAVVDDDGVDPRDPGRSGERGQRCGAGRLDEGFGRQPLGHGDDAVHLPLQELTEGVLLGLAAALAHDDERYVPVLFCHHVDAVEDHGEERVVEVAHQHADGVRLAPYSVRAAASGR